MESVNLVRLLECQVHTASAVDVSLWIQLQQQRDVQVID